MKCSITANILQLHAVKNCVGISEGFLIACRCCYMKVGFHALHFISSTEKEK